MIYFQNNKKAIVSFSILLLVILSAVVYLIWKNKNPNGLTEEQKMEILRQLSEESANSPVLPEGQKLEILNQLSEQSTSQAELSEDQKLEILNSLNQ